MHEYTVEFRIYGEDLNPSEVTNELGLEPTLIHLAGERRSQTTVWQEGMWGYNGYSANHGCKEWQSLEDGLLFLIEKLNPVKPVIKKLKRKYRLVMWCGCFQEDVNSSLTLSPLILKMLGSLGVELTLDTYISK